MHRYKRLIITAVALVLLIGLVSLVQAQINRGFYAYLNKQYPNHGFKLATPSVQLFPLRYEVEAYSPSDDVKFTCQAVFGLNKIIANNNKSLGGSEANKIAVTVNEGTNLTSEPTKDTPNTTELSQSDAASARTFELATSTNPSTTTLGEQVGLIRPFRLQLPINKWFSQPYALTAISETTASANGDSITATAASVAEENAAIASTTAASPNKQPEATDELALPKVTVIEQTNESADNVLAQQQENVNHESIKFTYTYSDNYLAQKRAKEVATAIKPVLKEASVANLVSRWSIDVLIEQIDSNVSSAVTNNEQILSHARLLIRFNSQIKDQASLTAAIKNVVDKLQVAKINNLDAIYFESEAIKRNDNDFQALGITAATWVKTAIDPSQTAATSPTSLREDQNATLPTVVVASGYNNAEFYYAFNYNMDFMPLTDDLIKNGLRIVELHNENRERFGRAWNYNFNY